MLQKRSITESISRLHRVTLSDMSPTKGLQHLTFATLSPIVSRLMHLLSRQYTAERRINKNYYVLPLLKFDTVVSRLYSEIITKLV